MHLLLNKKKIIIYSELSHFLDVQTTFDLSITEEVTGIFLKHKFVKWTQFKIKVFFLIFLFSLYSDPYFYTEVISKNHKSKFFLSRFI